MPDKQNEDSAQLRSRTLNIRCTEDEYAEFERRAEMQGIPMAKYVRQQALLPNTNPGIEHARIAAAANKLGQIGMGIHMGIPITRTMLWSVATKEQSGGRFIERPTLAEALETLLSFSDTNIENEADFQYLK